MKKTVIKLTACALSFLFIVGLLPVKSFADSSYSSSTREAISFVEDKGLIMGNILNIEPVDNGEKIEVQNPDNESSTYIIYLKSSDGIQVIVNENGKENEIFFDKNGQTFVDGIRCEVFESKSIVPYSTMAISYYTRFEKVPGYSYWCTQDFKPTVDADDELFCIAADWTETVLAAAIAREISVKESGLLYGFAKSILSHMATHKIQSAYLELKYNIYCMKNPTTSQYLYKKTAGCSINSSNVDSETVYELNTFN